MNRLLGGLFLAVAFAMPLRAETVARVLTVPRGGDKVVVYTIADDGTWTEGKTVVSKHHSKMIRRAVCVNGIMYVLEADSGSGSGTSGFVFRYTPDGTFIDEYLSFEGAAEGLAVTSDGRYLFIANNEGTYAGRIMRYDMVNNVMKADFAQIGSSSYGFFRQLCVDNAGHLYAANRGKTRIFKMNVDNDGTYSEESCEAKSASGFTLVGACCWDPSTDRIYGGGASAYGAFAASDLSTVVALKESGYTQWSYSSVVINGKVYMGSFQTSALWLVNPTDCSVSQILATKFDDLSDLPAGAAKLWTFDDAAGAAVGAESVILNGARTGASGVKGNSLCLPTATAWAELADTRQMLPATNDFAVTFHVVMPATGETTGGRILLSNDAGQRGTLSVMAEPTGGSLNTLGLIYTPTSGASQVVLTTSAVVADGKWHHVGVVRTGVSTLALRLDGEVVGSVSSLAADDLISQAADWRIGADAKGGGHFAGAGTFVDDLRVFGSGSLPLASDWWRSKYESVGLAVPTIPEAPARTAQALDAALGTEIAHAFADVSSVKSPNLFKAGDAWYAAASFGSETKIWKSTDGGSTWAAFDGLAATAVSLFVPTDSSTLMAIGMSGVCQCAIWSYDSTQEAGARWTKLTYFDSTDPFRIAPGPIEVNFGHVARPVAFCEDKFCRNPRLGYLRIPWSGGAFGDWKLTTIRNAVVQQVFSSFTTVASVLPATCAMGPNGSVVASSQVGFFSPLVRDQPEGKDYVTGADGSIYISVYGGANQSAESTLKTRLNSVTMPGMNRDFAVVYDADNNRYYALTTPGARNRLALYVSNDLRAWKSCGELATAESGSVGFISPAALIDGDDLVVAYGVACDDNAGGPRSIDEANYLAVKRFENFRSHAAEEPDGRRLFVSDGSDACSLRSYWQTASGDWLSGTVIVGQSVTIGGETFTKPKVVKTHGRSVYVGCIGDNNASRVKIFKFNTSGEFMKLYLGPEGLAYGYEIGLALSPNGKYMYVTAPDANPNKVWRVNTESGLWETFVEDAEKIKKPHHLAVAPNGDVFTANYSNPGGTVYRWASDGTCVGKVNTKISSYVNGMAVDDSGEYLYVADVYGPISKVNLSTNEAVKFSSFGIPSSVSSAFELAYFQGKLYVTATYGWVYAYDALTGERSAPVAALFGANGISACDVNDVDGLMIFVR